MSRDLRRSANVILSTPILILGMLFNGTFIALDVYASGLFHLTLHFSAIFYTIFLLLFSIVSIGATLGGTIGSMIAKN
jgi:hypothetical protein